jgi:hypothetical protein
MLNKSHTGNIFCRILKHINLEFICLRSIKRPSYFYFDTEEIVTGKISRNHENKHVQEAQRI